MNIYGRQSKKNILDHIEIASPCSVSWDNMNGDAVTRHCGQCQLSVYNISEMSKSQAEKLIQEHEGRLCIRLYRRFDGTVITKDCPIGLRKIKQSLDLVVRTAAALLSLLLSFAAVKAQDQNATNNNKSPFLNNLQRQIKVAPNSTNTNSQTMMGKPAYRAPSGVQDKKTAGPKSSIRMLQGEPTVDLFKSAGKSQTSGTPQTVPNKSTADHPKGHVHMGLIAPRHPRSANKTDTYTQR